MQQVAISVAADVNRHCDGVVAVLEMATIDLTIPIGLVVAFDVDAADAARINTNVAIMMAVIGNGCDVAVASAPSFADVLLQLYDCADAYFVSLPFAANVCSRWNS